MPHRFQGIVDLTHILSDHGITKAVVSPGSRNVPLINSFLKNQKIECISVVDERSAGYYALGLALKLQQPVVLFCTSGTATLNYTPAIAEAYHQKVPLIVLTADRPPELINQRDNQTINQVGIYNNFIAKSFVFPTSTETEADLDYSHRIVNEAASIAKQAGKPVHINIPLREPLYVELPEVSSYRIIGNRHIPTSYQFPSSLLEIWNNSYHKIVLVGQGNINPELEEVLVKLAEDDSIIVLAENLSNLCLPKNIASVERVFLNLKSKPNKNLIPDLLITLGGNVVSKQLKLFLRENKPQNHWHISDEFEVVDTYNSLTNTINANPVEILSSLLIQGNKQESDYQKSMLGLDKKLEEEQIKYLKPAGFSDLQVYEKITESLPTGVALHLGNSTPIRYSQLFVTRDGVNYFSNRGVSGIDGSTSTAAGYAREHNNITLLIIGDISFLYDSNALWIQSLSKNLRIIVINNGGGDIFRWINASENKELGNFIETPQKVNIGLLVKACGLNYMYADNPENFATNLEKIYEPSETAVVFEVNTANQPNADTLKKLYYCFKDFKNE